MIRLLASLALLVTFLGAPVTAFAQTPALSQPSAAPAPPPGPTARSQNVEIALLSERKAVAPGETFYVAIQQTMAPKWHTYWRNPGDTGEATTITWTLPSGASAGDILWPAPTAIPVATLTNYGFYDRVLLPVPITVPDSLKPGDSFPMTAAVFWLECEDVCIPAEGTVSITLPVAASSEPDTETGALLAKAVGETPTTLAGQARYSEANATLTLSVAAAAAKGASSATFFPYSQSLINHAGVQTLSIGPEGLTLAIPRIPTAAPIPQGPVLGVLVVETPDGRKGFEVTAEPGPPLPGTSGQRPANALGGIGLPLALAFGFLGGLILNLMPCVFPVLSMKALSLAKAAHGDRVTARRDGLLFMAGVLVTFLSLAGLLIVLQATGNGVGWGFQLQSPVVVIALATLMFLIGMNLLGTFEFGSSLQGVGSGLAAKGGPVGAFFTGVLAVVVASPCTAPFMGGALGFAATQPPAAALAVFLALGFGFALPFTALAFAPALLRALPRPGPWMTTFRQALAFPMFATTIWLVWVATAQIGATGTLVALTLMLACGLAIWLFRMTANDSQTRKMLARGSALAILLATGVWGVATARSAAPDATATPAQVTAAALPSEPWSPERIEALRAEGRPVFVDFTAAWCVTCKVNETVVLNQPATLEAFKDTNAAFLVGDWTSRDPAIAAELARHGRAGVPLYLVYDTRGGPPIVLPQVLTPTIVREALEAAAG